MPPQWRCSPHQSAKVSSMCLRAKDHLEGTKVAVFPSLTGGHRRVATRKTTGDPATYGSGRPRGGRWWDTDRVRRRGHLSRRSPRSCVLGKPSKVTPGPALRGNRLRCSAALSGVSRRAHAERRSTSRLALCVKVDQKCGRSTSEEVAANFVAGSPESTEIPHVFGTWPIASGLIGSLRTFAGEIITFSLRLRAVQVTAHPVLPGGQCRSGPQKVSSVSFWIGLYTTLPRENTGFSIISCIILKSRFLGVHITLLAGRTPGESDAHDPQAREL